MKHTTDPKIYQVSEQLKAMAHPIPIQIILQLDQQKSINGTALQTMLNLDQSLVSRHLISLNKRGILNNIRQGKEVYYSLVDSTFSDVIRLLLKNQPT